MSRQSGDVLAPTGTVKDGYDYAVQVWVKGGVVQPCGHPATMRVTRPCCAANRYQGQRIEQIRGHQVQPC
jgi:hypothetical protein